MSLTLSVIQKVILTLQPRDSKGNPAPLDGPPIWDASDPSLINLIPSVDGLSAEISARGGIGHVQVSVIADARLGPEVRELTGVIEIDLVPAEAVTLGIVASEPIEIDDDPVDPVEPVEPATGDPATGDPATGDPATGDPETQTT